MNDHQKRETVKKVYSSQNWRDKVNKMSDAQVTAIYIRLTAEQKL